MLFLLRYLTNHFKDIYVPTYMYQPFMYSKLVANFQNHWYSFYKLFGIQNFLKTLKVHLLFDLSNVILINALKSEKTDYRLYIKRRHGSLLVVFTLQSSVASLKVLLQSKLVAPSPSIIWQSAT